MTLQRLTQRSLLFVAISACGGAPPAPSTTATPAAPASTAAGANAPPASAGMQPLVDSADRSPQDRALDAGRKPAELLALLGVKPGMRVADLAAGGGYTTELLARAVGEKGVVFGQNNPWAVERFAKKPWEERVAKPVNKNVVTVVRDFDEPLPPEAKDLDAVVFVLFYHDTVWLKVDRAKMNANIFRALKPGGAYVVVDHSGRPGTGTTESNTLHRIEEKVVRSEVEQAGFKLAVEGAFLREPSDSRDWNASPMSAGDKRGKSDRFVLKFVKP
ncbi:MAG: class I SAM-dependent methyltransferase [Myxococcales bacterium]|nr:class I SAM-dependent methyltransferase [Myxococcales bacterium]